jgi:hypothetical protein
MQLRAKTAYNRFKLGKKKNRPSIALRRGRIMQKLYVSQSLIDVESRKELLDQAEIPCTIKNQRSAMLGGEVPFVEVFPELWVLQDEDYERAQTLLNDWEEAQPLESTSWTCVSCGEVHQKEFTTCWKCNEERQ